MCRYLLIISKVLVTSTWLLLSLCRGMVQLWITWRPPQPQNQLPRLCPSFPGAPAHTPTCWPLLLRCPGCSVCSTWMRMYSWSVMSTIPPAKGPPTCSFSRALSRKSVRFMAARRVASREKLWIVWKNSCNRLKPDLIFSAAHIRTSHVCDAASKDTEGVCGGDCQHPPGVVSVRIHAEEKLQAQQGRHQTHKDEADCQQDTLDTQAETEREQLVPFPHV